MPHLVPGSEDLTMDAYEIQPFSLQIWRAINYYKLNNMRFKWVSSNNESVHCLISLWRCLISANMHCFLSGTTNLMFLAFPICVSSFEMMRKLSWTSPFKSGRGTATRKCLGKFLPADQGKKDLLLFVLMNDTSMSFQCWKFWTPCNIWDGSR